MTQPVLVTGGAGYIGSHVCKALAAEGHDLVVLDDLSGGHRAAVRWGPLEVADLRDAAALESILARHKPWAVMNFAGLIAVGESVREPAQYYDVNVGGLTTLLAAAHRHGVSAFVFSSSASVYGMPRTSPIPEDSPMAPLSPYAWSKRMAEQMLADFGAAYGLRSAVLRYFNAAGADPDGELGEAHDPETHLIPLAIRAALDGPNVLSVFGDDYDTPDGTPIRDYIHVTDLAEAHVRALDRLREGQPSLTVNLGTGTGYSVREVIAAVERAAGRSVRLRQAPRRPGDAPVLVADPGRAFERLDWRPRLSSIDKIVGTALQWEREYKAAAECQLPHGGK